MRQKILHHCEKRIYYSISISQTPELSAEVLGCLISYSDIEETSGDNSGAPEEKAATFEQAARRMKFWFQGNC